MLATSWIGKVPVFSAMKKTLQAKHKRIWVSTEVTIMAFSIAPFGERGPQQGDKKATRKAVGAGTL